MNGMSVSAMTRRSKSLSGPAEPAARDPNKIIRFTSNDDLSRSYMNLRVSASLISQVYRSIVNLYHLEGFDDIAFLEVIPIVESQAALHARRDLTNVVAQMLEGGDLAGVDECSVAGYSALCVPDHLSVDDIA